MFCNECGYDKKCSLNVIASDLTDGTGHSLKRKPNSDEVESLY